MGSDGNDFMHRQKIASQYSISAENKKLVKYSIYMHFMLSVIIQVQLVFHFVNKNMNPAVFQFPEVPKPQLWQYIWLTSLIPGLAGFLSLNRSRLSLMKVYYYGTVVLGLGTVLATMVFNAADLLEYAQTKKTTNLYHEFPIIVLWYMYLMVVIQIHAFGIYFSRTLIQAWTKQAPKKTN